jgi:hypothetical protein
MSATWSRPRSVIGGILESSLLCHGQSCFLAAGEVYSLMPDLDTTEVDTKDIVTSNI